MAGIEIRDYHGDFEDVAELARRIWISEYGGRAWSQLPDAAFMRWQLGAQSGAWCIAAYAGTKLVGSVFSIPHSLRIRSSVLSSALIGGLTIDSDHRRLALPLIERLRRLHEERKIAFALGLIPSDPTTISNRFWTKYAQTFPRNLRFLFRVGYWIKILAPRPVARAGIQRWERLAGNVLGPLVCWTPHRHDPHVRPYRAGDLERCAQILDEASADLDWASLWSRKELTHRLGAPTTETLVFERDGCIRAMVSCDCFLLQGRQPVRAAVVTLWAADGLTGGQRVRLLGHVCNHLRERDVHIVLALRCAMMPDSVFVANLFLPPTTSMLVGALSTRPTPVLVPPKTWRLMLT